MNAKRGCLKNVMEKIGKKAKTVKQSSAINNHRVDANAGRFKVSFGDTVFDVLLRDFGPYLSAIDSTLFQDLISRSPRLSVKEFDKPLQLAGAFNTDNGTPVFSSHSVTLTITIYLPGSIIPMRVR